MEILVPYKYKGWDASETPFFCICAGGVFDALGRVKAAAGFGVENCGGGIATFGGHVEEGPGDFDFGLEGAAFEWLAEVFAQGGGRDAESLGDFVMREADVGEEFDLSAEVFGGFEGRTAVRVRGARRHGCGEVVCIKLRFLE